MKRLLTLSAGLVCLWVAGWAASGESPAPAAVSGIAMAGESVDAASSEDSPAAPPVKIRVLVAEGLREATLRGLDLELIDGTTFLPLEIDGEAPQQFLAAGGDLYLGGKPLRSSRLLVRSPGGFVKLNDKEFVGTLEVRMGGGRIQVIDHLPLEQYLGATVAGEMPASWPMEALKAQAVVARTYAWIQMARRRDQPYDVASDVRDQVFLGADGDRIRAIQAVRLTEGVVLVKGGTVVESYYHSTCGGVTEIAPNVWPEASRELPSVSCGYCQASPASRWSASLELDDLAGWLKEAGFRDPAVTRFEVLRRSPSGRALSIELEGASSKVTVDGNTFRRLVGYERIKSARFTARMVEGRLVLDGEGFGHGVGMCQWGARGMALKEKRAEEILEHYYPGTERGRLSGVRKVEP